VQTAIQICVLTAFSLVPKKVLSRRCCSYVGGSIAIGSNDGQKVSLSSEYGQVSLVARPTPDAGLNNAENLAVLLGDDASLSQAAIDLIALTGLSLGDVAAYTGFYGSQLLSDRNSTAGYSLEQSVAGQAAESTSDGVVTKGASNEVLIEAQVEVGDVEAIGCDSLSDNFPSEDPDVSGGSTAECS